MEDFYDKLLEIQNQYDKIIENLIMSDTDYNKSEKIKHYQIKNAEICRIIWLFEDYQSKKEDKE